MAPMDLPLDPPLRHVHKHLYIRTHIVGVANTVQYSSCGRVDMLLDSVSDCTTFLATYASN